MHFSSPENAQLREAIYTVWITEYYLCNIAIPCNFHSCVCDTIRMFRKYYAKVFSRPHSSAGSQQSRLKVKTEVKTLMGVIAGFTSGAQSEKQCIRPHSSQRAIPIRPKLKRSFSTLIFKKWFLLCTLFCFENFQEELAPRGFLSCR